MRETFDPGRPAAARDSASYATLFGLGGSLLAHLAVYLVISWLGALPSLDFEVKLPMEVEFGLTEAVSTTASTPSIPTPPATEPTAPATSDDEGLEPPKPEKKPKPKKKPQPDAGSALAEAKDAGVATPDAGVITTTPDALAGFAPAGTQLSLRINMARIRESDLVDDVRQLLSSIPDWRLILEGSQIDAVSDLDRLFLASPDLRREKLVIAGQYNGDSERVRAVVANMANARGQVAEWSMRGSFEVAPWHNTDTTPRVIALVGPQQFVICRPVDLPRVLAVAEGLAKRAKQAGEDVSTADALLGTSNDEVWSLSVEGARQFVPQRIDAIPTRLQIGVRPIDARKMIEVRAVANFDDATQAETAKRYWDGVRNRFGSHPLVSLMGMSSPLMNARIELDDSQLNARSELNTQQVRMLLGFVRNALTPPPPPPPLPSAPPTQPVTPTPQAIAPTPSPTP